MPWDEMFSSEGIVSMGPCPAGMGRLRVARRRRSEPGAPTTCVAVA